MKGKRCINIFLKESGSYEDLDLNVDYVSSADDKLNILQSDRRTYDPRTSFIDDRNLTKKEEEYLDSNLYKNNLEA